MNQMVYAEKGHTNIVALAFTDADLAGLLVIEDKLLDICVLVRRSTIP